MYECIECRMYTQMRACWLAVLRQCDGRPSRQKGRTIRCLARGRPLLRAEAHIPMLHLVVRVSDGRQMLATCAKDTAVSQLTAQLQQELASTFHTSDRLHYLGKIVNAPNGENGGSGNSDDGSGALPPNFALSAAALAGDLLTDGDMVLAVLADPVTPDLPTASDIPEPELNCARPTPGFACGGNLCARGVSLYDLVALCVLTCVSVGCSGGRVRRPVGRAGVDTRARAAPRGRALPYSWSHRSARRRKPSGPATAGRAHRQRRWSFAVSSLRMLGVSDEDPAASRRGGIGSAQASRGG